MVLNDTDPADCAIVGGMGGTIDLFDPAFFIQTATNRPKYITEIPS